MIDNDMLTMAVSLIAIIIAYVSLVRTNRIQKVSKELNEMQIELIEKKGEKKNLAFINVKLKKDLGSYKFFIINEGNAPAKTVYFSIGGEVHDNPLFQNEYSKKIPNPSINPGNNVTLNANIHLGRYTVFTRWLNPDGTQGENEIFTSI